MSNIPADLKYTDSHEWVRTEADGSVTVGITAFAQDALGDIVFVELPAVGTVLDAGTACAVVESVKAASDIYTPVSGKVIAVNEALGSSPELINADAFDAWMFKLEPADASQIAALMSADAYSKSTAG
jgi:glycine cleavage system H protein